MITQAKIGDRPKSATGLNSTYQLPPTWIQHNKYIIINVVGLLLLIFFVIVIAFAFRPKHVESVECTTKADKDEGVTLALTGNKMRFVSRDEWIAQPPVRTLTDLNLPINRVIITHSASEGCETQAQCVYRVRIIQTFHMESKKWDDIGYNFLVGGDGAVYEGRGWDKQGAFSRGYNEGSIGIAFIGTFTRHEPPQRQFDALKSLLDEGVRLGMLTENYKMYPLRALLGTESPGEKVIEVIKTWPHYMANYTVI